MSGVVNVIRLTAVILVINFISITFLILGGWTAWDIAACISTIMLSSCIIMIEAAKKWGYITKEGFINALIIGVLVGGASAFFWFFHVIYKVGHYQGDYTDILWSVPSKLIVFGISVQLIITAHREYSNVSAELMEEEFPEEYLTSSSKAQLSIASGFLERNSNYDSKKQVQRDNIV